MSREEVKEQFGVHRELVGGGRLKVKAGDVGADTRLVLAVAQSLADREATDFKDVARRLLEAFAVDTTGAGLGPTTRTVLSTLKPKARDMFATARKLWEQQGRNAAGGGCIPRVSPVGMLRRVQFKELVTDTINVCRLTHYDPRSIDAAIAFNFGVSYLTSGKDPSKLLFKAWRFLHL
jgi:ADP-ribosyl-[dinitrogen reductase] hydrolase